MNRIPASEIREFQERMGWTDNQTCRILQIELPTWTRWKTSDTAPPFLKFALRYLEQTKNAAKPTGGSKKGRKATDNSGFRQGVTMRERFEIKTQTDGDCVIWTGGNSFKLDDGRTSTPRRASWLIKHSEIPSREVVVTCGHSKCVEHLELGNETRAGASGISEAARAAALLALRQKMSYSEITRRYGVGKTTLVKWKKEIGQN